MGTRIPPSLLLHYLLYIEMCIQYNRLFWEKNLTVNGSKSCARMEHEIFILPYLPISYTYTYLGSGSRRSVLLPNKIFASKLAID